MPAVVLVSFEPDNEVHVKELVRQRQIAGFGADAVDAWREKVRRGVKSLQWVFLASPEDPTTPLPYVPAVPEEGAAPQPLFAPVGHIAMDWEAAIGLPEVASKEEGNLYFTSLYVLQSAQGRGLGNLIMTAAERLGSSPPFNAKILTLSTWDSKNFCAEADLPNLREITDWRNAKELWYQRRGYVPFIRAASIPYIPEVGKDGTVFTLNSVYMKKKALELDA
ncbi:hypothetical protein BCR35DRAFT_351686 [Leucosporidium creatinivorum]|uniref:Uncharacterized protein n=1 Tax=Leucosporidium creatinivorum TaxID=106004 RepID=A0A1Y2FMY2_9BASI|nr:hypothetical protein BCR35DRAFT_351686 [Leucosporidium creatinivorum]